MSHLRVTKWGSRMEWTPDGVTITPTCNAPSPTGYPCSAAKDHDGDHLWLEPPPDDSPEWHKYGSKA